MTTRDKAYEWIDAHKDDMVDLWKQMVTIDSGIGVKEGGMEMGNLCAGILEKLGFSIRRVSYEKCGDTIIGERGDLSKPYTILMGHMDTVFFKGEPEKRPFTIKDGKAYGPGVLDMRAASASCSPLWKRSMQPDLMISRAKSSLLPMKNRPTYSPMRRKSSRRNPKAPSAYSTLKQASRIMPWSSREKAAGVSSLKPSAAAAM